MTDWLFECAGEHHRTNSWTVLWQSPHAAWFGTYEAGVGGVVPFEEEACGVGYPQGDPFSALAFSPAGAIRWNRGRDSVFVPIPPEPFPAGNSARQILWGVATGDHRQDDVGRWWTLMNAARIGRYPVPVLAEANHRVFMELSEITARDAHGNVSVRDAIPVGLGVLS